ncbi:phosphogluconate dehydratase [Metallibacterium scheffleri]|jgi:phosphogluconate dehydratase|uniref:phosphogluconate dehydratase n=1 Tax=Metallibacterium scheffleri TaxID=993689 RepID=UPI0026EE9870|nr:phosphogluconate dehydratase [Metallibacterium scheffleri]MBW8074366.1 phosphogluconate dehydratase [Metallibacterium scheffleri]
MSIHPHLEAITRRICERSAPLRQRYLAAIDAVPREPARKHLSCGNLAHGFAASDADSKTRLKGTIAPNLGIVSAYNDMLSAHQPFEGYPALIRQAARAAGATAQVAGGVPAMCDGITQGQAGMELSLFSRDVIAQAAAVSLSHAMFDSTLYLGVCDKIVPGMLIGALSFGHLPAVFVPAGPMPSGISNQAKAKVRERYAAGEASKAELLAAEAASYHAPGTCTFYGTANSNQLLLEAMGLMLPGAAFVNPGTPLREALTRAATLRAVEISTLGNDYCPLGQLVDERAIVNALVVLLATGGSTNHSIHWVAVARAAGIVIDWDDIHDLSEITPLLVRMYPNGDADVNRFETAGGIGFVIRELLDAGLLHEDVRTVFGAGLRNYTRKPKLDGAGRLHWAEGLAASGERDVLRGARDAFEPHGGLRLVQGNLGRALVKIAALKPELRRIEAPAVVIHDQHELARRHSAGTLPQDFIAVLRFQGPHANGMPELHSLTPLLGHLQNQGRRVALVTDGRLSGASGKTLSAIHLTPEAARGGLLAKVHEGDSVLLDAEAGVLSLEVDAATLAARAPAPRPPGGCDVGRRLFGHSRAQALDAEHGALSISLEPEDCSHDADALRAPAASASGAHA